MSGTDGGTEIDVSRKYAFQGSSQALAPSLVVPPVMLAYVGAYALELWGISPSHGNSPGRRLAAYAGWAGTTGARAVRGTRRSRGNIGSI